MPEHLDLAFMALADPHRRAILAQLAKGEATVMEIVDPLPLSQPAVSRHLKVLQKAGLISRSREATSRPARIRGEGMAAIVFWLEQYRSIWGENYNRLDDLLVQMKTAEASSPENKDKASE